MTLLARLEDEYVRRTPRSRELYEEARRHLPGGVSGTNKFMKPHPLYIQSASGCRMTDVDGNEYIDLLLSGGPHLLGHRNEAVVAAVRAQLEVGFSYILPTELEVEFAKKLKHHMPFMELVRFANTGSEATLMALRAARAYTGRDRVAKFEGHFHGHAHDNLLISSMTATTGPDGLPAANPDCAGIPRDVVDSVLVLPLDDSELAARLIRQHAHELAAVFIEPVPLNSLGGQALPTEFLRAVRAATEETGVLMIYDEVVTGFRLAMGGATAFFGVQPDMSVLGKVMGGGLPIGAYGGRRDVLERVVTPTRQPSDLTEKIFHSGTFTANPLSLVAGLALIAELEKGDVHEQLNSRSDRLREGLREAARAAGVTAQVTGEGSLFQIHFTSSPIRNLADVLGADRTKNREFCFGLMARGVFWPLAHGGLLSAAHSDDDVDEILAAAGESLSDLR
jgi:glutamate-1-semialdehyde 2,1-aminomutase